MSQYVVCIHFARCDDSHNCGGARPHLAQYCEPCGRYAGHAVKPTCAPVILEATKVQLEKMSGDEFEEYRVRLLKALKLVEEVGKRSLEDACAKYGSDY